ncbi:hypothetical protein CRN79_24605 [Serratia fonticola]|uniref:hypothetical protein n=1 Tax=Serratia fonticola TaxID=47917 RepID=UPI000BFCC55A|nr:hypothetical protein [Serratia fonticola]ATM78814.1 hypothetical protein CRN79_24605 [Serratia fonticola]
MMQPMTFNFDPELAKKAGVGTSISENGAYEGAIISAVYTFGKDGSQSQGLELSLDSNGSRANYLRINFLGRDGEPTFGMGLISALLWAAGIKSAQPVQVQGPEGAEWHNQALEGKNVGLVLQKTLYTKQDGGDGYKMEVRQVFKPGTKKTYAEHAENAPAEAVDKLVATLKDRDERDPNAGKTPTHTGGQSHANPYAQQTTQTSKLQQAAANRQNHAAQQAVPDFDDDIPF